MVTEMPEEAPSLASPAGGITQPEEPRSPAKGSIQPEEPLSSGQYVPIYPDISDFEENSGPDMSFEEGEPDNINKVKGVSRNFFYFSK